MANSASTFVGVVEELWRYPVKSMLGERLTATTVTENGCLEIAPMRCETLRRQDCNRQESAEMAKSIRLPGLADRCSDSRRESGIRAIRFLD
jgi:hypothetical protein